MKKWMEKLKQTPAVEKIRASKQFADWKEKMPADVQQIVSQVVGTTVVAEVQAEAQAEAQPEAQPEADVEAALILASLFLD